MAPKRRPRSNKSLSAATAFDGGTFFSDIQMEQRSAEKLLVPAPADQKSGGSDRDNEGAAAVEIESSDEIGENGVVIKRQPPPRGIAAAKPREKNVSSSKVSSRKRKAVKSPTRKNKKRKAAAVAAPEISAPPPPTRNAAAAQLARSRLPKKAAVGAATEAGKSPRRKKAEARAELAGTPAPTGSAGRPDTMDVAPSPEAAPPPGAEDAYDAEKHFKQKSLRYCYLWQMARTLEQKHSISFKRAFLKMDDTDASIQNTKLQKMALQQLKQCLRRNNMGMKLTKVMLDLID